MKFSICLLAAILSAASYGWSLGNVGDLVGTATNLVPVVNVNVHPTTHKPEGSGTVTATSYDIKKRQKIQDECESKLSEARAKSEIDYNSQRDIKNWLSANKSTIVDASTEANYRAVFNEKLNAAKNGSRQESVYVKCQTILSTARTNREIDELTSYQEISDWLKTNKTTIVDEDTESSFFANFEGMLNEAKNKLIAANKQKEKEAAAEAAQKEKEREQQIAEQKEKEKWIERRRTLRQECDKELRYARQNVEIGREGEEIDKWYKSEVGNINNEADESKFKTEFKSRCDDARAKMAQRKAISGCYDECVSAVKDAKLSYEGRDKWKAAVREFFTGSKGQGRGRGDSSEFPVTLDEAEQYKEKLVKELNDFAALPTSTDEIALQKAVVNEDLAAELCNQAAKQLVSITTNIQLLASFYNGDMQRALSYNDREIVSARLVEFADNISDTNIVMSLLKESEVVDSVKREKLLSRLPNEVCIAYVTNALDWCGVRDWNENKIQPFDDAIVVLKSAKGQTAFKIVLSVLAKFSEYEKACKKNWLMSWGDNDMAKINKIVDRFPKLDDAILEDIVCADETSWLYVTNSLTANVAYNVLAGGKAKSGKLEESLVRILPQDKIDMKVYNGARFTVAKNALYNRMSPSLKESVANMVKKAYMDICVKAKSASKNTFELYGFYLGMSFDDVKIVLAHHFPDLKVREEIDGEGENSDYVIYVDGQKSPFCFAKKRDNKVWLFNFGKKLLRKWYDFDTQTYMEWAVSYGEKTNADLRPKMIEDKTTVYEQDMSNSYTVWFHQEAYQYKNNKKDYLLTYFGEERDFTFEDGIGGDIIKSMAAEDFRYVRGDPGSLRVRVVRDE